jgi:hypothetical protein
MADNIVQLRPRTEQLQEADTITIFGCVNCNNKTFILVDDYDPCGLSMMKCSACQTAIGRVGWWNPGDNP